MHTQTDLSKGTSAEHLTGSVEIRSCFWRITFGKERFPDFVGDVDHFSGSRREGPVAWVQCVATISDELGNLLGADLSQGESFLGDVDRISEIEFHISLLSHLAFTVSLLLIHDIRTS